MTFSQASRYNTLLLLFKRVKLTDSTGRVCGDDSVLPVTRILEAGYRGICA